MTVEERQPIEDIAEKERQRYKRQMLTYVPPPVETESATPTTALHRFAASTGSLSAVASASSLHLPDSLAGPPAPALPSMPESSHHPVGKDKPKRPPSSFLLYAKKNESLLFFFFHCSWFLFYSILNSTVLYGRIRMVHGSIYT